LTGRNRQEEAGVKQATGRRQAECSGGGKRDRRQTIRKQQKAGGMIQETCRMGRRRQETDSNEQEEAGDRQEWLRRGRRQTGMSRRRQETDRNG
jgi:hypothetical protein